MKRWLFFFTCLSLAVFSPMISFAGSATTQPVTVTATTQAPDTDGNSWVALDFNLEPGWHLSKELPNEMGAGVTVLSPDPNLTVGPLLWPQGGGNEVSDHVTLLTQLHSKEPLPKTVTLNVQWVACDTQCVPGRATLTLDTSHLTATSPLIAQALSQTHFSPKTEPSVSLSFGLLLLAAFAGGMLLNLMPCVLPVLSLKVISLIGSAQDNAKKRLRLALAYLGGVMLSFWALSGVLLGLQASGQEVGWGFQLQQPWCVALLAGLFFLLSLNLFGLFEWGTSLTQLDSKVQGKEGVSASFWSGILATVVATPCTGPLLGASVGMAMTLPWIQGLALFSAIGFGMALPLTLIILIPACARFLPKPGNWMVVLKQLMGFVLLGAVLWLVWVWQAQTSFTAVMWLLAGLLLMSIGAWVFGHWGGLNVGKRARLFARVVAFASLALFGFTAHQGIAVSKEITAIESVSHQNWEPFTAERVQELEASKTPFFIDFTAKWCLICQMNKAVLHNQEVEHLFKEKNVIRLQADWTKGSPEITKALKQFGRSGVPLYVFSDGNGHQKVLPETLTVDMVKDTLQNAR